MILLNCTSWEINLLNYMKLYENVSKNDGREKVVLKSVSEPTCCVLIPSIIVIHRGNLC